MHKRSAQVRVADGVIERPEVGFVTEKGDVVRDDGVE